MSSTLDVKKKREKLENQPSNSLEDSGLDWDKSCGSDDDDESYDSEQGDEVSFDAGKRVATNRDKSHSHSKPKKKVVPALALGKIVDRPLADGYKSRSARPTFYNE